MKKTKKKVPPKKTASKKVVKKTAPKKTAKKAPVKSKALAKQETKALATPDLLGDAGLGYEGADSQSYAIPFLGIMQKMSPQLDKKAGEFIDNADEGDFLNTATLDLYDGDEGVYLIPCAYQRSFVEWTPRDQGGGFRGQYDPESIDVAQLERDDSGKFLLPNGNILADTRYHFCLLVDGKILKPVIVGLTSTQIKASRNWMTAMRDRKVENPKTKMMQSLPTMACIWKMSAVPQSNDKGSWMGVKFEFERMFDLSKKQDESFYLQGKEFNNQIAMGRARAEEPAAAPSQSTDGDMF